VLYRTLGWTAQDRTSILFLLALGALLVGGLAFLIALVVTMARDYDPEDTGVPDNVPGPPTWDVEFTTGGTGDALEDLGLVEHESPLPSDSGRKGS
jgi:hypothetical protein